MVNEERSAAPPYVSFKTFLNLLDRLKEGGIPQRIDRSYWGDFLAGGYGAQVMTALRYLDLLDENNEPKDQLEPLASGDRKAVLAEILRSRYAPIFSAVDLSRVTSGHLDEVFRKNYGISGQTARKVVAFFVQAAQHAGISVSPHILQKTRTRSAAPKTLARANGRTLRNQSGASPTDQAREAQQRPTETTESNTRSVRLRSGGALTLSYSVDLFDLDREDRDFVFGLIDQLREYGQQPSPKESVQTAL